MSMTLPLRVVLQGYRFGWLKRGAGVIFDNSPTRLWGGDQVTVPTEAGEMTLPVRDHGPRQLLVFGALIHEAAETRLFAALAPRLERAVDIGANVGWYSCLLGHSGLPTTAKVIAAEPNPNVKPYLVKNAARYPQILVINEAISDTTGTLTFFAASSSDLSSSTRRVGEPHSIPSITLDDLVERDLGNVAPDLVKCDVEGGEYLVLLGARKVRNAENPPIWMIEADERFLLELGLSYERLEEEVHSASMPLRKFFVGTDGRWTELATFADLRSTKRVNVALVPESRQALFDAARW